MNIENIQYRLRKRRLDEIFDFSLVVIRRNLTMFMMYAGVIVPFFFALNLGVLYFVHSSAAGAEARWVSWTHLLLLWLILFEQPLFTLPLILLNGSLVFNDRPRPGEVFQGLLPLLPVYLLRTVILRTCLYTLFLPLLIPIWLGLGRDFFQSEVILLEKLRGRRIRNRLQALTGGHTDRTLGFLLLDLCLGLLFILAGLFAWQKSVEIFNLQNSLWIFSTRYSLFSPITHLLVLLYAVFHAVAKFLYYIDVRSLLEGWDIELLLIKGVRETDG